LRRRDEARAGEIRLEAHSPIQLGRVPYGLVNREPEIRRLEDEIVAARFDRLSRELFHGDLRPLGRMSWHVERLDVLPALAAGRKLLGETLRSAVARGLRAE